MTEVKKGDCGEDMVRKILEQCGFIVYQAITEAAHLIDFIVERNKKFIFFADVKTKPKFNNYPATGIDLRHYEEYKTLSEESQLPVLLVFVDESLKKIYGNFLHVLDEPRRYCNMNYPGTFQKNGVTIRYYPLNAMCHIADIDNKTTAVLTKFRRSAYA